MQNSKMQKFVPNTDIKTSKTSTRFATPRGILRRDVVASTALRRLVHRLCAGGVIVVPIPAYLCGNYKLSYHENCRIVGHIAIILGLVIPLLRTTVLIEEHRNDIPDLQRFADLRTRFATLWNVGFQVIYALVALVIDYYTLKGKEERIPEVLRNYRYTFFAGIIYPVAMGVLIFWPVYIYDRELVYKTTLEVAIPQHINCIVHGFVFLYANYELAFLPRHLPKRDNVSWNHLVVFNVIYMAVVFYTRYVDVGVWVYDVLTAAIGTIMFPTILFSLWALSTIGYYLQWVLKYMVWWLRDNINVTSSKVEK